MMDGAPLVLAADDSEIERDLLELTLNSGGYERFEIKESGEAMLDRLKSGPRPDVILLDIMMDGIDGVETCARIRAQHDYADVPILMVTAQRDEGSLTQAFMAGANDYVTKPYDRVELLARINSALQLHGEYERRLQRESALDEARARLKIGIENDAFFDAKLAMLGRGGVNALVHRLGVANTPYAVIAIQIDALARFAQRHGQDEADNLVARVADTINAVEALIGAQAGTYDEGLILVLVPHARQQDALVLGERICRTVNGMEIAHAGSPVASVVTVSVGIAAGRNAQTVADAIQATEKAYTDGGNRVSCA
ncbi:MAG TPA: response regulator [Sphingomonas sp.]|jgi:PleD family two-component response regulator|nr:response regulator [Sphingomonas sp.]